MIEAEHVGKEDAIGVGVAAQEDEVRPEDHVHMLPAVELGRLAARQPMDGFDREGMVHTDGWTGGDCTPTADLAYDTMSGDPPTIRRNVITDPGGCMVQESPASSSNRGLGLGGIATIVGGAALIIFIIQNRQDVAIDFLWWSFTWPLWLYSIVMAVFGALVWLGLGVMRRHQRRQERREDRRD